MKVEMKEVPVSTIEAFAEEHGLTMEVIERGKDARSDMRYFAHFKNAEVMCGGLLIGAFGNGPTPEAAISAYAIEISEERIAVGAGRADRKEYQVPRLVSKAARLRCPAQSALPTNQGEKA